MNAKPVAEELLILMAYGVDLLMFPTFRNWNQSYEGWLYQNGLLNRLNYLESRKLLTRQGKGKDWIFQVTEAGLQQANGGRNPDARWQRKWDGWWRQIVFDLPLSHHRLRPRLIRWLRRNGFGYLQDSVWISPDPVSELAEALKEFREDAESFTVLECRCAPGFTNSTLVKAAWPLTKINEGYRGYQRFAIDATRRLRKEPLHPRELFGLLREERKQWAIAFAIDPLLPFSLWPAEYEGRRAWETRKGLLHAATTHAQPKRTG